MRPALRQILLGGGIQTHPQFLSVACGNSIAVQSQWNWASTSAFATKCELHLANMLCSAPMRFARITASLRSDRYGTYGYSGQTLATINGDIASQWFSPLDTAAVTPDLVVGLALMENSIANGNTAASIKSDIETWLSSVLVKWPSTKILLCTPRLSFSYNTAGIVAVYQAIRDYILAKDNGRTVFVARVDGYENVSSPGTPKVTTITGSISTTVLTVTATDGPIGIGNRIFSSGVTAATIQSYGTGRGGIGTYNLSSSQTVSSQTISVSQYTDETVHPNAKGALINARVIAAALRRVARTYVPFSVVSANRTLAGSAAASGTNVSGTVPTSTTIAGSALGTFVGTALQPGFQEAISGIATITGTGTFADLGTTNFGASSLSSPTQISPYAVLQFVSGSANLRSISLWPRVNDGGGNNFQEFFQDNVGDAEADWLDGDVLTFICPPLTAASGNISAATNYLKPLFKLNQDSGGTAVFRILEQGIQIVA